MDRNDPNDATAHPHDERGPGAARPAAPLQDQGDAFWLRAAPFLFPDERFALAEAEVDAVLRLARPRGRRALDLGCGPGRHALALARRGFAVTGIDRTQGLLDEARRRADDEGLALTLRHDDLRTAPLGGPFDLAVSLFTSFGYFEDPADDVALLRRVHESLAPGGALVVELMGAEVLSRIFTPRDWQERDGRFLLQEHEVRGDFDWIESRWIIVDDDGVHEHRFGHRLYAGATLREALVDAGFSRVALYGDLTGTRYDQQATRLVACAWRGEATPGGATAG